MRQLFEVLGVLLFAGVPSTYLYNKFTAGRNKDRCIATIPGVARCQGRISKLCVDNLCPEHCKQLHGDTCVNKFL